MTSLNVSQKERNRQFCKMSSYTPRERSVRGGGGDKHLNAIVRCGQAVHLSIERFVTLGEALADDNAEIKVDMYEACRDARAAGSMLEHLCEVQHDDGGQLRPYADKHHLARAARALLSSVTRVLLLADTVVVKQLLANKERVSISLNRLENVANFTEFVKAFSQFGTEMVEMASLMSRGQNDVNNERRRAQMAAARQVLERSTVLLLTASKACLRHPDCDTARENRDTVFLQMRRSMDVIHYVIKEGVIPELAGTTSNGEPHHYQRRSLRHRSSRSHNHNGRADEMEQCLTVCNAIRKFEDHVEMCRVTHASPSGLLSSALDSVVERSQDFTDSAYTSHEHRERILRLCDRLRMELHQLLRVGTQLEQLGQASPTEEMEAAIHETLRAAKDLKLQLQTTALEQAEDLLKYIDKSTLLNRLKHASITGDHARLEEFSERFSEQSDHLQEVCKLLHHVASAESVQVLSKNTEACLQVYGPQVLSACHTLFLHPSSKVARENVEVFMDVWKALDQDVTALSAEVTELCRNAGKAEKTSYPVSNPIAVDVTEQSNIAKLGLEMKQLTSEMDAETDKWPTADNDIVRRAKTMSQMAFSMYQFTRGEGELKTTQDLFTQAEFFAEEANRFYKVVRHFSYQVPGGTNKKEMLENLDRVPTFVQQLQFTVKNTTVGKAATFTKVDNVIKETKNLMNAISKVVTTCLDCAIKYNLDFGSASDRSRLMSPYSRGGEGGGEDYGDGGLAPKGLQSSSDPNI
ncbi:alpha-catulin-like [Uloborus diversus]|uniref:alpha-catulin-like n=1 Tax=Uloborus diversus TaxID=327109 RepID=UPI002409879D|nr:alpha-catulin-like [Uloborus diversus]